jgi:Raf kinase inhibitor-like YbhB/YbcL family protein
MRIASPAFPPDQPIPIQYTCKGEELSPPLHITDVPIGAQSLALILHDPDAVHGDWIHWVVWNIRAANQEIPENTLPEGAQVGLNSADHLGYKGPCPPRGTGTHRYMFELYALDSLLELPPRTDREGLEAAMQGKVIAQAQLIGLYGSDPA